MKKIILSLLIVFTTNLTIASESEVIDQLQLGEELYDVVLDSVTNVDETTGQAAGVGRKTGYLDVRMSVSSIKNNVLDFNLESIIFFQTYRLCSEFLSDSESFLNTLEPGYSIHMIHGNPHKGTLSDDGVTYTYMCKITYTLKS